MSCPSLGPAAGSFRLLLGRQAAAPRPAVDPELRHLPDAIGRVDADRLVAAHGVQDQGDLPGPAKKFSWMNVSIAENSTPNPGCE